MLIFAYDYWIVLFSFLDTNKSGSYNVLQYTSIRHTMGGSAGHSNLKNAVIAFLVPLPSIFFYLSFLKHYESTNATSVGLKFQSLSSLWAWCHHHPLLLANVLLFLNVSVLFWVIGQIQSSHWMIGPYWPVIPVMFLHYFATHPLAQYDSRRSMIMIMLTWVWSIRLLHSYFRREKWQWGAREDWRFVQMRQQNGRQWWWLSFFAIYFSQQAFLTGLSLPFYVVHTVNQPLDIWDLVPFVTCICGIVTAYFADTQLYDFTCRNEKLKLLGKPRALVLNEGLWYYSRHPNYFGEQLWWWGLAMFAWNLGHGWTFIGSLVNTMSLAYVTKLVEDRMLKEDNRAEAYRLYQKTTSVWIPWFKSSPLGVKDKNT